MFRDSAELISSLDATYGNGMGQLVFEEFEADWRKERAESLRRQRLAARYNHQNPNFTVDGLGQRTASIDGASYFYWHNREPGCWQDKEFLKEYLRDNPAARVPYTPRKPSVIVPASRFTRIKK